MVNALFLLMGRFDCRPMLTLDEVCEAVGYEKNTAYNDLSNGLFPIPLRKQGKRLFADVRDVAEYLDAMREKVKAAHTAHRQKMGLDQ
ncbi:helix-turn-helix transcriptional regulator [Paraburkholderia kururiensis]|uniref:helix-turn-helix transcriptional regulator n=1 Tax=Paraburkholderia kururiensis TaxID=984307 RepID=UPI0005A61EF5|nr:helix-turn-helix domain-containing protein [Paraburkholderia kururiensis]